MIKILGITYTEDLTTTSTLNWNNCIQKIKKQTQQLSRIHLSLRGKPILLNTMILSKVTSISNVFPISKIFQHTIETYILNILSNFQIMNLLQEQHFSSRKIKERLDQTLRKPKRRKKTNNLDLSN